MRSGPGTYSLPKPPVKTISSFTYWRGSSTDMYGWLKFAHMSFAALTISGFLLRSYWMLTSSALQHHRVTRILPHVIDTVFLASGVAMLFMLSLNPFKVDWLVAKFVALLAYIVLGTIALKRGRTRRVRALAAIAAIVVFAYIVGVAMMHSPASWLST